MQTPNTTPTASARPQAAQTPEPLYHGCFDGLRGYEIEMTLAQALSGSHQGDCYHDCKALAASPAIKAQIERYSHEELIAALLETGAWTREELSLMADDDVHIKCVWMAACDIRENQTEEASR